MPSLDNHLGASLNVIEDALGVARQLGVGDVHLSHLFDYLPPRPTFANGCGGAGLIWISG